ncbi:MAG: glycosyltransferase family 2 protein [Synergistaceae bacterium]|nr:glycosyltransferase family 2 protein [Candidatus Equadaptatus faecalis]
MKFSIIVPIYNVEKYLEQCVDSLICQTYRDIEIILVDDGSPDRCPQMCDEYALKDAKIKVIHKANGGLVSARQAGTEIATGDYIVPVDGDDWVVSNYVEKFAEAAEKYNADIICCGYYKAFEDNRNLAVFMPDRAGFYSREDIEREIFPKLIQKADTTYFSPNLWCKAFKRELYITQQMKVNPKIKIGEDGACTIPCIYNANSLSIIPECLYYYRQNPKAMTKNKKAFPWNGPELIQKHLERTIDISKFDFKEQLYRKTVHELFSVVVSQFYRKEPYFGIVSDIKQQLDKEVYSGAIQKAKFSGSAKAKLMHFALKCRVMWLIWLYSRVK